MVWHRKRVDRLGQQLNPNRIAFFGPAASGKTFCANHLILKHGYEHIAFAAKLKEIARDLFKVYGKNGNDRKILQDLGTKIREIKEDAWIDYVLRQADAISPDRKLVLDDLRYINEADALRAHGWTLVMVSTHEKVREWRLAKLYPQTPLSSYYGHASEQEWMEIAADYIVISEQEDVAKNSLDVMLEALNAYGHV